jgi:hypothetical protein
LGSRLIVGSPAAAVPTAAPPSARRCHASGPSPGLAPGALLRLRWGRRSVPPAGAGRLAAVCEASTPWTRCLPSARGHLVLRRGLLAPCAA